MSQVRELDPLTLPGGRQLARCEAGPPGAPVVALYLHGTGSSRLEVAPYAPYAAAAGVRIVAWDRPGHGGSPRQPGRTIMDVVSDARAVAESVAAQRCTVIGLSGGGTHVLALLAAEPDFVRHGIAINPGPPSDEATLARLGKSAGLMRLARQRPGAFTAVAAVLQSRNPVMKALEKRQADPTDRAIVFDSPLRPVFEAAAAQGRRQRGAWVTEARMFWGEPWAFAIDRFHLPLDVFAGSDDPFRPFSESLAAAGARLHGFPGGHLSGFTPEVMTEIVRLSLPG